MTYIDMVKTFGGVLLGSVLGLVGDPLRAAIFGPRIRISHQNSGDYVDRWPDETREGPLESVTFRIGIRNAGRTTARSCNVYITMGGFQDRIDCLYAPTVRRRMR